MGTELAAISLSIAGLMRDLYMDGVATGVFRDVDPDEAVELIGQQIYGAMTVRAGEPLPRPADEVAKRTCSFILRGLGV